MKLLAILLLPIFAIAEPARPALKVRAPILTEVDMVIAAIDGEPITSEDFRRFALSLGQQPPEINSDSMPEVRRILKELINQRLLEKEAAARGLSVTEEEFEAYLKEVQKQNNTDRAGFEKILSDKGISMEDYRRIIATDILRNRLFVSQLRSKVNVSDEDIDRYLAEHPELKPQSGTLHLVQVQVSKESYPDGGARAEIDKIHESAKSGTALPEGASSDLGYLAPGDLREEFLSLVKELEPGDISEVVETETGYVFFKLVGRNDVEAELPKDLKDSVRNQLMMKQQKAELEKYLQEELPKKYHLEMKI